MVGSPDPIPSVELNRQPEGTTTGIFHCTVPDANGVLQSMFVGVYDNNTGESVHWVGGWLYAKYKQYSSTLIMGTLEHFVYAFI